MFLDLWAFRFNSFGFHFSRHVAPAFWLIVWFVTIFKPSCYPLVETSYYQFQWLDLYTARSNVSNLNQLGLFLYTDYSWPFLLAAFQLLVAMVAAIVITLVEPSDRSICSWIGPGASTKALARQAKSLQVRVLSIIVWASVNHVSCLSELIDSVGRYRCDWSIQSKESG